ncbi:MAG: D-alanyl-D-alanine carboxypeptidase [Clostridia bacterium]|nr:D-alanyl-D-alanine carboxypeptidase [Clostridia bacterium]
MKYKILLKLCAVISAALLLASCSSDNIKPASSESADTTAKSTSQAQTQAPAPLDTEPVAVAVDINEIGVVSECVLLVDNTTGKTLIEKNSREKVPVASLTKLMTALVAEEKAVNSGAEYCFTGDVIDELISKNAARAGFEAGESVRLCDLLYAAMLPSGADGAYGLAMLVGGSIEGFVDMMNEKAAELGMTNTRFYDPVGLDDSGYSTAYDIEILMRAVLANSNLREIISSDSWLTAPTDHHPNGILLKSTVFNGFSKFGVSNTAIKGGKTGYTQGAGRCLATFAYSGANEYILVTLGANDKEDDTQMSFVDQGNIYSAFFIE